MKKILIITRCSWTLLNFRHDYINYIKDKNFKITVACDFKKSEIIKINKIFPFVEFRKICFLNQKGSILNELKICYQITNLFIKEKYHIIHNFTIRPIIYSTLIAKILTKSKIVNSITGLGHAFNNIESFFFKLLINIIYLNSNHLIFQNNDDLRVSAYNKLKKFIPHTIIFPTIKEEFKKNYSKKKNYKYSKNKKLIFLMFSRLIRQKGVYEYLNAAQFVIEKVRKTRIEFRLFGNIDLNNPSSLKKSEVKIWKNKKHIKIFSHTHTIEKEIRKSHIICLPSYGEGMPASLLESLYMSKAIVTTNVNGCKEIVKNNYNGYLVPKKDYLALANKFINIINKPHLINFFGKNSKKLFIKKFSKNPYKKILKIINSL